MLLGAWEVLQPYVRQAATPRTQVLLAAWEVLQLAVSSDDVGLVNVLDASSFARLLPLLGEELNQAKVERLFDAVGTHVETAVLLVPGLARLASWG